MSTKTLMLSDRTPRSGHMGLHLVIGANIVPQGTNPSGALYTERNVGNVAKTISLRQYECPQRDNR